MSHSSSPACARSSGSTRSGLASSRARWRAFPRGAAASFSLLPPQNTTGNWVKVTQRIPVRIRMLEQDQKYPFRLGASVTASIDVDSKAKKP